MSSQAPSSSVLPDPGGERYPYRNPALPVRERVEDLLGRMSLEEKCGQLVQYFWFGRPGVTITEEQLQQAPPEYRAMGLAQMRLADDVASGRVGSLLFATDPALLRELQEKAIAGSRWGIPLLLGLDVIHGFRTIFPVPIAQAASWDPEGVEAAQRIAAREEAAAGARWTFGPMVDITHDPRWGRVIEGAGEDPWLGAAMAAAQVRGFQGGASGVPREGTLSTEFPADAVLAGAKHFAAYGMSPGGRDYEEVAVSDATLHNEVLPPFAAAFEAGTGSVMSAYMELDGLPASANKYLLTDVLREEMGFGGLVGSDANAVVSLETQHLARSRQDAAARALTAGLDMEMCQFASAFTELPQAVADGLVSEADVDRAAGRVLAAKFLLGLFENPFGAEDSVREAILADPASAEASRQAAERSFVLLENDGVLPLRTGAERGADGGTGPGIRRIAVLGDLADSRRDTIGPWVQAYDLDDVTTVLDGVRRRAAACEPPVQVDYATATAPAVRLHLSPLDQKDMALLPRRPEGFDDDVELDRAVEVAVGSDVAIVVVGQAQNMIGENASVSTLELPGRQAELLERVIATGTPTVVLVMSGRPLELDAADGAAAVLQVWYPGTRGGEAVAAALFGDVSPAGRLPFSWPWHAGQLPGTYARYRTFSPDAADTRYWNDEHTLPRYAFGYGLSYARFEYGEVRVPERLALGEAGVVSVEVRNVSEADSDEVVQLYVHQRYGEATRPVRELKGFRRVHVPAGESVTVELPLGPEQLRYWSPVSREWIQEATVVDVAVGGSSSVPFTAHVEIG